MVRIKSINPYVLYHLQKKKDIDLLWDELIGYYSL